MLPQGSLTILDNSGIVQYFDSTPAADVEMWAVDTPPPDFIFTAKAVGGTLDEVTKELTGHTWEDTRTQGDLDALVTQAKQSARNSLDDHCQLTLNRLMAGDVPNLYVWMAHLLKGMEAIDVTNDEAADPELRKPAKSKKEGGVKHHKLLEQECASLGMTKVDFANLVIVKMDSQIDYFAAIEAIRTPTKWGIDASANAVDVQATLDAGIVVLDALT